MLTLVGQVPAPRGYVMSISEMSPLEKAWRQRGACNGLDPSIFFPETEEQASQAKSICEECQVRVSCLEHALARQEKDGVWGGATDRERKRIIRQRRRSA